MKNSFLSLSNIDVVLHGNKILKDISWDIKNGQQWVILGPNGSGKSTLVKSLWGGIPVSKGEISFNFTDEKIRSHPTLNKKYIGYVSFELHQNMAAHEAFQEEMRSFSHKESKSITTRDVILSGISMHRKIKFKDEELMSKIAVKLNITHLLDREISALSTGEMRKTLIARALMKSPKLLILDEPFDGLDEKAREDLFYFINKLMEYSLQVIFVTHRVEEILPNVSHALLLKYGEVFEKGERKKVLTEENLNKLFDLYLPSKKHIMSSRGAKRRGDLSNLLEIASPDVRDCNDQNNISEILIEMKDVTVKYGKTIVLDNFNWTMKKGENWAILGPNGSGKSTIVKLITGENLQRYANTIKIFGKEIGTGETIWEIKKRIGVVSGELQIQYRKNMSGYDVIASGFYDSIGLYQYPTKEEEKKVDQWIESLKIADISKRNYSHLSYGQKRMILLARAMVKSPKLLILDEPCHGLDMANRRRILEIIQTIGETKTTNLLYITHHKEEIAPCISNVLKLGKV